MPLNDAQRADAERTAYGLIGRRAMNLPDSPWVTTSWTEGALARELQRQYAGQFDATSSSWRAVARRALSGSASALFMYENPDSRAAGTMLGETYQAYEYQGRYWYYVIVETETAQGTESTGVNLVRNAPMSLREIQDMMRNEVNWFDDASNPKKAKRIADVRAGGTMSVTVIGAGLNL